MRHELENSLLPIFSFVFWVCHASVKYAVIAGDQVVRQRVGAITGVVMPVYILKQTAHMLTQAIIENQV
jgi:hypothetical protein